MLSLSTHINLYVHQLYLDFYFRLNIYQHIQLFICLTLSWKVASCSMDLRVWQRISYLEAKIKDRGLAHKANCVARFNTRHFVFHYLLLCNFRGTSFNAASNTRENNTNKRDSEKKTVSFNYGSACASVGRFPPMSPSSGKTMVKINKQFAARFTVGGKHVTTQTKNILLWRKS